MIYLSVIIPVYNEEERIVPALEEIIAYLSSKKFSWEIIVADDGSKDQTVRAVEGFALKHKGIILLTNPCNHGKGYVVRQGMLRSKGKYVFFTDADLSAPIRESDKLLFWIDKGYDIAIGSRALRDSNTTVKSALGRKIVGTGYNFIVQVLFLPGIVDTQCGFKCFKGEVARELFSSQKVKGFSFDVEILYLARLRGCTIKQVPLNWSQSSSSRVNLFRDSIKMFIEVLKIKGRWGGKRKGKCRS